MMRMMQFLVVLAALVSFPAFADSLAPALPPLQPTAPAVTLTAEQFTQLVAKTVAGPALPILPAGLVATTTTTPAAATMPAPITAVLSGIDGTMGPFGLSWATIGGILTVLFGIVFAFWKGAAAARVKACIPDAIDAAYWFVEKNFGDLDGPHKAAMAMGNLYQGLTGHGVTLTPQIGADAATRWQLLAGQNPSTPAAPPAPAPAELAAKRAAADTAAKVAAGATAADLLGQAGAPKAG